jgi:two-component system, chemotaxis family, CheB/CheR fusion protein
MARGALGPELALALRTAQQTDRPVRKEDLVLRERNADHALHLEVVPVRGVDSRRRYLVVFEPAQLPTPQRKRTRAKGTDTSELERTRQELFATKEYLHAAVSQHLAANEELGIASEELQSFNEELQSTNEELQTAKEELQSTNEELETVNEQLQVGNVALREAADDLANVLASVDIAIVIVDTDRHVRRFTPKAHAVMRLIPTDVGRPIADLQPNVTVPPLDDLIARVIESLAVHESEVEHTDGTWYRMQIRPYQTADHKIAGAVLAFVDITALRLARDQAIAIVETVPTPLVVVDGELRVSSANAAFYATLGLGAADTIGQPLLGLGDWRAPELRARLLDVVSGAHLEDVELDYVGGSGARTLRLGARPLPRAEARHAVLVAIADVTERRQLELAREAAQREREGFLDAVSHELRTPLNAILLWTQVMRDGNPDHQNALDIIEESVRSETQLV